MDDSIYLMGSEDVRSAAHEMTQAAETMKRASGEMHDTLTRFIEDFRELVVYLKEEPK
ncbi:hypothetical protein LCGC14_2865800 [marine sediment metagenome]|uniref:Uncharacterized protein n=1 Tax=marine sediment metagenome TaxID=412755 RepID=A0A0F9AVJ9_9ZZZZ